MKCAIVVSSQHVAADIPFLIHYRLSSSSEFPFWSPRVWTGIIYSSWIPSYCVSVSRKLQQQAVWPLANVSLCQHSRNPTPPLVVNNLGLSNLFRGCRCKSIASRGPSFCSQVFSLRPPVAVT